MRRRSTAAAGVVLALSLMPLTADARPETIVAGVEYYSNALVETDGVRDLGAEKNYEEVFQFFRYYSAVYDAEHRVSRVKEYKRGEVVREDRYTYDAAGKLVEHEIRRPGVPPERVPIPP